MKSKKGKGPPGLKVLPIPPQHLQDNNPATNRNGDVSTASNALVEAISLHDRNATTSENLSASPAATSLPPRASSPPPTGPSVPPRTSPASTSGLSKEPDAPAVTAVDHLVTQDHNVVPDVLENLALEAAGPSSSVVLPDTTDIVHSPEPMDLGPDEPEQPPTSVDHVTAQDDVMAQDARSPVQVDKPEDVAPQLVIGMDDRVEESCPPATEDHPMEDAANRESSSQLDSALEQAVTTRDGANTAGT